MHHVPERIVLVTGASRGIGAEVAQQLADPNTHVIVNYREKAKRAEDIAEAVRDAGAMPRHCAPTSPTRPTPRR